MKSQADVFLPQVAGQFYDNSSQRLRAEIASYIDQAGGKGQTVSGRLLGMIVPHAGYPYSGPIAAHAFALLGDRQFRRVVVLGPAHQRDFRLPALLDADAYRTPLGDIPIDRAAIKALAATGAAVIDNQKFTREHALEVELPFLQATLSDFQLVPVMISRLDPEGALRLARAFRQTFPDQDTLYVASTDLSHDFPYDVAVAMDKNAMRYVSALDIEGLHAATQAFRQAGMNVRLGDNGQPVPECTQLCGVGPVLTLLSLAGEYGSATATVLDRRNSGDIVGDKRSRIVGYAAAAVTLGEPPASDEQASDADADYLDQAEKDELLEIARTSLETYVKTKQRPDFAPTSEKLLAPGAAFVTLKQQGRLRGCIGHMEPSAPLWQMIRDRAVDAAVHDPRFRPVSASELPEISIEISVLTPRVKVTDPLAEIKIGRDGVWLEKGHSHGVFLPQVPVEQGWDTVEEYLDNLCRKAHITQRGCWKSPDAVIQRFAALVFGEPGSH